MYKIYHSFLLMLLASSLFAQRSATQTVILYYEAILAGTPEALLDLTEKSMHQMALTLVEAATTNPTNRQLFIDEGRQIKSVEITKTESFLIEGNETKVITTLWDIPAEHLSDDITLVSTGNTNLYSQTTIEYMLQKFGDDWKIISQRQN